MSYNGYPHELITSMTVKSSFEIVTYFPINISAGTSLEEYRSKGENGRSYVGIPLTEGVDFISYENALLVVSSFAVAEEIPDLGGAEEGKFILDSLEIPLYKTSLAERELYYCIDNLMMIICTTKSGILRALGSKYGLETSFLGTQADSFIRRNYNESMFSCSYTNGSYSLDIALRFYEHNYDVEKVNRVKSLIEERSSGMIFTANSFERGTVSWIRIDEYSDDDIARQRMREFKEILSMNHSGDDGLSGFMSSRDAKTKIILDDNRVVQTLMYDDELFDLWLSAKEWSRKMREEAGKKATTAESNKNGVKK